MPFDDNSNSRREDLFPYWRIRRTLWDSGGHGRTGTDMDDAPYTGDLDLGAVNTCEDLAVLLRAVHTRADKPSLRTLEARTRHSPTLLSKTATAEMLKGVRFPRKAVMLAFLQACGVPEDGMEPWRRTWERVASGEGPVLRGTVQAASDLQEHPAIVGQHFSMGTRHAARATQAGEVNTDESMAGGMPASAEPAGVRQLRDQIARLARENERLRVQLATMKQQARNEPSQGDSRSGHRARSPALCRRELATLLHALRIEMGMTVEQVAEHLMCSQTKVKRMESSFRSGTARDVRDLCELYRVTEAAERNHLMELARVGKQQAGQQPYPLDFSIFLELEADATSIKSYDSAIISGLVQTADYARAVIESFAAMLGPEVIEQRIEGRLARQRWLTQADPPRAWFILDEAALHRAVGGPTVMKAQLERLIEVAGFPNVTIQVIPYDVGVHEAIDSNFIMLEFASYAESVVHVEGLVSSLLLERPKDVEQYKLAFDRLLSIALSEEESIARIAEVNINLYGKLFTSTLFCGFPDMGPACMPLALWALKSTPLVSICQ
jgi:transcriptional regulator with XRE-family HTH domain